VTDETGTDVCDDCGDPMDVETYVHDGEARDLCAACVQLESNYHFTGGGREMQQQENQFTGVKVFAATKHEDRQRLGETITDWMRQRPHLEIVDKIVTQSSDAEFHCVTITLFYREIEVQRSNRVAARSGLVGHPVRGER
jgi:hypothetical protein